MRNFFAKSDYLDMMVLRPLSHILPNWELTWNNKTNKYVVEKNSYAKKLNHLLLEIERINPPKRYHDNEDFLAEYVKINLKWPVTKKGNKWICGDYSSLLEQGGFGDINEKNLIQAASGRIHAAIRHGQNHFDDMEEGHMKILASVISIILYHRSP